MKDSFILYTAQYRAISLLTLEQKGRLLDAIFLFAMGEPVDVSDDTALAIAFSFIEEHLKADADKYDRIVEARREAGRKGMQSRWHSKDNNTENTITKITNAKNAITKITLSDTVSVSDTVSDTDIKEKSNKKERRFIAPTKDEVEAYCQQRGNGVDAQRFVDFYESKGWRVGSSPMKSWQAAVRTWEQRDGRGGKVTANGTRLGVGEFIAADGTRRYGTGALPPVPMDAPPRPDDDSIFSAESKTWIPAGL